MYARLRHVVDLNVIKGVAVPAALIHQKRYELIMTPPTKPPQKVQDRCNQKVSAWTNQSKDKWLSRWRERWGFSFKSLPHRALCEQSEVEKKVIRGGALGVTRFGFFLRDTPSAFLYVLVAAYPIWGTKSVFISRHAFTKILCFSFQIKRFFC